MKLTLLLTVLFVGQPTGASTKDGLFIASFNIQKLGLSKVSDKVVLSKLTEIVTRYDLVFIQEIVDSSLDAVDIFLESINKATGDSYRITVSPKAGKEFYAYLYKKDKLKLLGAKLYNDRNNYFKRDPYMVAFSTANSNHLTKFGLIGIHTSPDYARYEIGNLTHVYSSMKSWKYGDTDAILMGDFNAGCHYFPKSARKINPLYTSKTYEWVIPDTADTTAHTTTECPYDRFVLAGRSMKKAYVPKSAGIYNFSKELHLDYDLTLDISDHYPIQMRIN